MNRWNRQWGVYLVTDRRSMGDRSLETVVRQALAGGAAVVQLREKNCSFREFTTLAEQLKRLLAPWGVPLIINDRVDVALSVGAEGVHLGQSDMPYPQARRILGNKAIIGLSVESMADAQEAAPWDVDYLGVSPIFPTPVKTDTGPPWGLEGLRALRRLSRHPLIAIGGINADNAAAVIQAGADGIAVVSAICAAPDPEQAARTLTRAVESGQKGRANP